MEQIKVDGCLILIPSASEWVEIFSNPHFDGLLVYTERLKNEMLELYKFTVQHSDRFLLGLERGRGSKKLWLTVSLFRMGSTWQRVYIERSYCKNCLVDFILANPSEPSLYLTLENDIEALRVATKLPRLGCPNCGENIDLHAIWIEMCTTGHINSNGNGNGNGNGSDYA